MEVEVLVEFGIHPPDPDWSRGHLSCSDPSPEKANPTPRTGERIGNLFPVSVYSSDDGVPLFVSPLFPLCLSVCLSVSTVYCLLSALSAVALLPALCTSLSCRLHTAYCMHAHPSHLISPVDQSKPLACVENNKKWLRGFVRSGTIQYNNPSHNK
jgi:hypothetical protein